MAYIGNRPLVGRYQVLDNITFNGSNTQYSLTVGGQAVLPGSAQNLLISVGGVLQAPSNAYSVSGSNILFTGAPAANAAFFGVQLGDVFGVATVANTGYTSLRQQFTASNGQTQFAISGGYVPGQVDVYRNGIKLVNGQDTNISSGANVVLSSAAANNDTIDVIGAQQITIGGATTMIRQQFTTANNQTQFAITNGYTPGMIDVYLNGIKQIPGTDVNVSSGSNVVFNVATVNNSVVDVSGYQALSVYNGYTFRSGDTMTGTLTAPAFYANNGATDVAGYLHAQPTMRNRIINGDMRIDQRNAGASVTPTANSYNSCDRWQNILTQASKYSVQQNAGAVTPPVGFTNYLGFTSLASTIIAVSDIYYFRQIIEGYNISDLAWGTANAKAVTLSFYVRSSLTGTFSGSFQDTSGTVSYVFTYSIASANTWTQIALNIPGPTTGTWGTTNTAGMFIDFNLGAGTNFNTASPNTWLASSLYSTASSTNIISTSGSTLYITGVQLESGSYATPFERRLYNMELMMCQRYYEKSYSQSVVPGTASTPGRVCILASSVTATTWYNSTAFKVAKRTNPTVVTWSTINANVSGVVTQDNGTDVAASLNTAGEFGFDASWTNGTGRIGGFYQFTASAEL